MRKFIVTIEGKSYEVGVEEVGAEQSTSVVKQTVAAPAPAQQPAAAAIKSRVSSKIWVISVKTMWI